MPVLANAKHERVCQEYLIDLNQTEACKRAKYSAHTAAQQASRLFSKVNIQQRIAELMAVRNERTRVTQDKVVKELAMLGFSDLANYITIDPLTGAIQAKGFEDMPPGESRALKAIKEDRAIKEDADSNNEEIANQVRCCKLMDEILATEELRSACVLFHCYRCSIKDVSDGLKREYKLTLVPKIIFFDVKGRKVWRLTTTKAKPDGIARKMAQIAADSKLLLKSMKK